MMSYECVNRVPWFWRRPGAAEGCVHEGVMTHLDLTPTVLDLAGAEPLLGAEGRSFAGLLGGDSSAHRDAVIVERISVIGGTTMKVKMLVTEDWKLLHYGSAPYGELYDVKRDPEDLHNLWDEPSHAGIRRQLTERLLAELIDAELGDPARILRSRSLSGALRDARRMEPQPETRASLNDRRDAMRDPSRSETDDPRR
jgi:arylsulfatase A-like enzyme